MSDIVGAVLIGGQSVRMGRCKGLMTLPDGRTALETIVRNLENICSDVVMLTGQATAVQGFDSYTSICDLRFQEGPLAGIEALLESGLAEQYLVASCDAPTVPTHLLESLIHADSFPSCFHDSLHDFLIPFPATYSTSMLPAVKSALDRGNRSVSRVLSDSLSSTIDLSPDDCKLIKGFNTPAEFEALFIDN